MAKSKNKGESIAVSHAGLAIGLGAALGAGIGVGVIHTLTENPDAKD